MRPHNLSFPLLAAIFLLGAARAYALGSADFAAIDGAIVERMAKHGLPGVALAVLEGGRVAYLKAYGRDGEGRPMSTGTRMLIGSQSKSFTALAIAQLAEDGKLDLGSPVRRYVPWFRVADEAASGAITIDHLLHHTSGLSDSGFDRIPDDGASLEEAVRSLAAARLTAPVGSKHQYFNYGYAVLQYLVEIESGRSYSDFVKERIFEPLGMASTSADSSPASMPRGYIRLFGFPVPARERPRACGVGAGWIVSTAEDMARYALAFRGDGAGLVSPAMLRRVLEPGPGSYGMGWYVYPEGDKVMHGGANDTFRTEVDLYPKRDRGFILMTDMGSQIDHFVSAPQLTDAVEDIVLGEVPEAASRGWSARWIGWAIAAAVLALGAMQARRLLSLRSWRDRMAGAPPLRRALDIALCFAVPTAIVAAICAFVGGFYGNRFNPLTSLAYMPRGMPDLFVVILVGTIPDYAQGIVKLALSARRRFQAAA